MSGKFIAIKVTGVDALANRFAQSLPKTKQVVDQALKEAGQYVKTAMIQEAPVVVGGLRKSIKTEPGQGHIIIGPNYQTAPHALWVITGTKPHAIPVSAMAPGSSLYRFAKQKGIPVGALWQSIRMKGTKANPFIEKSYERSVSGVQKILSSIPQKIVDSLKS